MAGVTRYAVFRLVLLLRRLFVCLQLLVFGVQLFWRFTPFRIEWNAADRTNLLALRFLVMAHALGAFMRVYLINFRPHVNRIIGAFGFADITIDAIVCNHQGHVVAFMCCSVTTSAAPTYIGLTQIVPARRSAKDSTLVRLGAATQLRAFLRKYYYIYFKTCSQPAKQLSSSTSGLPTGTQILTHHRQTWRSHAR